MNNILAIGIAVLLFVSIKFPKVIKHSIYGIALLIAGAVPLLNRLGIIGFNIPNSPIVIYVLNIMIAVTGGTLIWEAIKEDSLIRWPTFAIGGAIIAMSIIPALYNAGAITFNIPSIPEMTIYIIRVLGGILLILAVFLIG